MRIVAYVDFQIAVGNCRIFQDHLHGVPLVSIRPGAAGAARRLETAPPSASAGCSLPEAPPELLEIDQWYAAQFAYLVKKLDSVVEGDGTMLDNTLVVWGREMGQTNHRMQPVNLILAGGARGGLATGRYLSFDNEPHAKLLVSICRLMGADISSFNRDMDTGPLAGV